MRPTTGGDAVDAEEAKFGKSKSNQTTQNSALAVLLADPRFQVVDRPTKLRILELLPVQGAFGAQTFDLVVTPVPTRPITASNVAEHFESLSLIEMKSTKAAIKDSNLNGFFFGATEREYAMAAALGDRCLFAFVVLSSLNKYGRSFAVLLTLDQVERRTQGKRTQFQVNFRNRMSDEPHRAVILGGQPLAE
jgi:hypothetical protein